MQSIAPTGCISSQQEMVGKELVIRKEYSLKHDTICCTGRSTAMNTYAHDKELLRSVRSLISYGATDHRLSVAHALCLRITNPPGALAKEEILPQQEMKRMTCTLGTEQITVLRSVHPLSRRVLSLPAIREPCHGCGEKLLLL